MTKSFQHVSVLLGEAVNGLNVKKGEKYIDATGGGGGHAEKIINLGGKVLAIDQDTDAVNFLKEKLGTNATIIKGNFRNIEKIAREENFAPASGVLFDLGVSSHQIDTPERGFSYRFDADLDMRMDKDLPLTAKKIINTYSENELEEIFSKYGELENAKNTTRAILLARKKKEIKTTGQLLAGLENKLKRFDNSVKSRIFQALRIVVNDEIESLKKGMSQSFNILKSNGRLCVISFHSLEDRAVKEFARKITEKKLGKIINKKPITASKIELETNKRAKSAKLRVIEKI